MVNIKRLFIIAGISAFMLFNTAFAAETAPENEQDINAVVQSETDEAKNMISQEEALKKGLVNVDILNVRSGPSTDFEKLGKLSLGTTVEIKDETGDWYEIDFDSKTAYIFAEYVTVLDNIECDGNGIANYAETLIGTPYLAGGNTAEGFDCSGFVQYVMSNFDVNMPRTSTEQYSVGVHIDKSQLLPGDLVFFKYTKNSANLSHVGIYVSEGNFIHSPVPGQSVKLSSLTTGYFSNYYYGATRIIN